MLASHLSPLGRVSSPSPGTISRYRIPIIPFLADIFVIMEYHLLRPGAPTGQELGDVKVVTTEYRSTSARSEPVLL